MIGRWLIAFGLVPIAAGLLWPVLPKLGLLLGDIVIERENVHLNVPMVPR